MQKFVIEGGRVLSGTVTPSGNKNEALPVLMATLLTDQPVVMKRMPRIGDVVTCCEILADLGARVEWSDEDTLVVEAQTITKHQPAQDLCSRVRASIMLLGPMLARTGSVTLPLPGGDVIGARRIDTHFEGIEALGGQLKFGKVIEASLTRGTGAEIFLDEPSVTATENLIMLATLCQGRSTLYNAACEPHVIGLCAMLNAMGAKISGVGSNRLEIDGVSRLTGCEHTIGADFMEVGSFLCLGAISGGRVTVRNADVAQMHYPLRVFRRLGIDVAVDGESLTVDGSETPKISRDIDGRVSSIKSGPWPAYPTDLMSVAIVAATQANGTIIFFEKMFEGRMFFTDKLMAMGANIVLCDPHRVVVTGPSQLFSLHMSSPDVRAGMALLMAALRAKGTSEIDNVYQIERGYLDIDKKLEGLGAAIRREQT